MFDVLMRGSYAVCQKISPVYLDGKSHTYGDLYVIYM